MVFFSYGVMKRDCPMVRAGPRYTHYLNCNIASLLMGDPKPPDANVDMLARDVPIFKTK